MAKLSEVEEMLEKAEADEENEKIITGHKNKKEDEAKSGWKVVLEYVRVIAIGALIAFLLCKFVIINAVIPTRSIGSLPSSFLRYAIPSSIIIVSPGSPITLFM